MTHTDTAAADRRWALEQRCTDHGDWYVTQGAWDYCQRNGHARYVVDGVTREHCPRCGTLTAPTTAPTAPTLTPTPALWLDIDGRLYVLRYGYVNYYQHTGVTADLGDYESQGPVVR